MAELFSLRVTISLLKLLLRNQYIRPLPDRIQLMLLRLLRNNLQLQYVPWSHMYIADTLSRAKVTGEPDETMDMAHDEYRIHMSRRSCPPQMSVSKSYVMLQRKMQPYRNSITSRTMGGHQRSRQYPWMCRHIGMYGTLSTRNNHYSMKANDF